MFSSLNTSKSELYGPAIGDNNEKRLKESEMG